MDDQIRSQLEAIDLSGVQVAAVEKHHQSIELVKITNERLKKLVKFGLVPDLANFNLYTFRHLNFELASLQMVFDLWAFLLDDHLDNEPGDYEKWTDYIRGKSCPKSQNDKELGNLEKLFNLIIETANRVFPSPQTVDELISLTLDWVQNYPIYEKVWKNQWIPSDEEYLRLRIIDAGGPNHLFFMQISAGLITEDWKYDQDWLMLNKSVSTHLVIINDLYSLKKEIVEDKGAKNHYRFNYVYIKMRNNKLSLSETVQLLFEEASDAEKLAYKYGEKLKAKGNTALNDYVDGVIATMAGNHYWSSICKRYNML